MLDFFRTPVMILIFTARVRSTREGNVLTPVCVSVHTFRGGGGYPVSVKGKIFDTRFGLIHVQTGGKFFVKGPPPPTPPVIGKIFDTRFGLIHVQTGEKNFCQGTPPPPPAIARNCYGYAAGGMPLAFTQEDFLVTDFSTGSRF